MVSDLLADDLRDTLAVFETAGDPCEPLTTTDVTERLDVGEERSAARLETLAGHGFLKTKTVGTGDQLWWRPPERDAETEQSFSALVANVPGMIYQCRNEPGWPMAFVSDGCRQLTGYEPEALETGRISFGDDVIHPEDGEHVWDTVQEGLEDDGRFTIQYRIRTADDETRWVWERGRTVTDDSEEPPILEGLITDITELKTQAQHLKREIDEVFERVDDAFYALDTDFRFTYVNDRAEELLQHTEADMLGESVWEIFPEATETPAWESFHEALDTQQPTSYELYYEPLEFWVEANVYPSETGLSVYFRDVTERKEREQTLREERDRFNALFESVPEAVVHVRFEGDEPIIQTVNSEFEDVFGYSRADLVGTSLNEHIVPARFEDEAVDIDSMTRSLERCEVEVTRQTATGEREFLFRGVPFESGGETLEGIGVYIDITERKQRARELDEYHALTRAANDAILTINESSIIQSVTPAIEDILGYDRDGLVGESLTTLMPDDLTTDHREGLTRYLKTGERHLDWNSVELPARHRDGHTVPLAISFSEVVYEDRRFFTGIMRDITDRKERERELERQREQLAALNELHGVVREINDTVIERSTRNEIERRVCEQLAASESYAFAWIGDVESHGDAVRIRADARAGDYLADVDISIDPDTQAGHGPTARALRTGEMQVVHDTDEDAVDVPWHKRATEYGVRSSAAIPIAYDGTLYGVLNVYSERSNAFDETEREVIGQLGEIVGHAINAIERKQALMSDEIVELEFHIQNVLDEFGVPEPESGRITFDRAVPLGDEEFLEFGTATGDAFETLQTLVDVVPHFADLTVLTEGANEVGYELHLDEPPVLSAVAAHGGRARQATLEDGDWRMPIEVPPGVGVRRIADTVQETYPGAEVIAQRQITRHDQSSERIHHVLTEELTDRQRTVLETAYYAGFFDWPRKSTGEEIAETMGVVPATFHQHLRAGQNKLLGALFTDESATA